MASDVRLEVQSEQGCLSRPAQVLVYEDDELIKKVVGKVVKQQGLDGGYYPCVQLTEEVVEVDQMTDKIKIAVQSGGQYSSKPSMVSIYCDDKLVGGVGAVIYDRQDINGTKPYPCIEIRERCDIPEIVIKTESAPLGGWVGISILYNNETISRIIAKVVFVQSLTGTYYPMVEFKKIRTPKL